MSQPATRSVTASLLRVARHAFALSVLVVTASVLPARAESLTTVKQEALPAPPAGSASKVHAVGTSLVALHEGRGWQLPAGSKAWQPVSLADGVAAPATWASAAKGVLYLLASTDNGQTYTGASGATLERGRLNLRPLPAWPTPLKAVSLAEADGHLYASGLDAGGAPRLYQLTLATPSGGWIALATWPAGGASSLLAQRGDLFATVPSAGGDALWRWHRETGWSQMPALPGRLVPQAARSLGQAHLLYLLASDGAAPRLETFHTITKAWASLPATPPSGIQSVTAWGDGLVLGGEDGALTTLQLQSGKHLLTWLDWLVIVVYLAAMIGIGLYFYLREKRNSTENFFVGSRTIPFWAAGLSLYAVNTSSISFIAIPAKAFETNWQYLTNNLIAVLGLMFVAIWIVPLLRRLNLMSTFSYLETRFHPSIRMLASALAILMQIGSRMSVILFLPALAISTITGIDVVWSVWLMGGFTIIYSELGGMKAVIWNDVVQVILMMGGGFFAILFIVWTL